MECDAKCKFYFNQGDWISDLGPRDTEFVNRVFSEFYFFFFFLPNWRNECDECDEDLLAQ